MDYRDEETERLNIIIYTTEDGLSKIGVTFLGILSGCLLTKWQNYFSVTEMLWESALEMFLKKVNCKKKQCR